jgi:hypothetical protein
MSARDLLLEVYRDMKFVRPALENLLSAGLVTRVEALEQDRIEREAHGVERRRIGDLSARSLAFIIMASNFVLGLIIMFVNLLK